MDWVNVVTNVGFPIAVAIGLGWFTKDRLDKSEAMWAARAAEWKEEKKDLIAQLIVYRDKMEGKLTEMEKRAEETINRNTMVVTSAISLIKSLKGVV